MKFFILLCVALVIVEGAPASDGEVNKPMERQPKVAPPSDDEDATDDQVDTPVERQPEVTPPGDEEKRSLERREEGCGGVDSQMEQDVSEQALAAHNNLRGMEEATNELELSWSDAMASRAQQWADQCEWKHGMLNDCNFKPLGQNMFISAGGKGGFPSVNIGNVVKTWANEKSFYHFDTKTCDSGKMCGHYTQVVWSKTEQIGCGVAKCDNVQVGSKIWENAVMVVCDYTPAGNYVKQAPFEKGVSCAACEDLMGGKSGWLCDNNLCRPCTPESDDNCQCSNSQEKCQNGASFNAGLCTCDCPSEYYGSYCENKCECADAKAYKRACKYWKKKGICDNKRYKAFMSRTCPLSCGTCKLPESCNA